MIWALPVLPERGNLPKTGKFPVDPGVIQDREGFWINLITCWYKIAYSGAVEGLARAKCLVCSLSFMVYPLNPGNS